MVGTPDTLSNGAGTRNLGPTEGAQGNTIKVLEPMVDGQLVTEFVAYISDRLNCFVEDVIVHALQTQMPEGISISEIPVAERPPEIVERFHPALVGGGMPIWKILYHDSKFEDH